MGAPARGRLVLGQPEGRFVGWDRVAEAAQLQQHIALFSQRQGLVIGLGGLMEGGRRQVLLGERLRPPTLARAMPSRKRIFAWLPKSQLRTAKPTALAWTRTDSSKAAISYRATPALLSATASSCASPIRRKISAACSQAVLASWKRPLAIRETPVSFSESASRRASAIRLPRDHFGIRHLPDSAMPKRHASLEHCRSDTRRSRKRHTSL